MLREKILDVLNIHHMDKAYIMIYFFDQVVIGKYSDSVLFIPSEYNENLFDEIHIFNHEKELRWSRENECVSVIEDTHEYLEESMYIIGNKSVIKEGYSIVSQYGRELILPFEVDIHHENNNLQLVVHHLFSNDVNSICGYRLVDIKGGDIYG